MTYIKTKRKQTHTHTHRKLKKINNMEPTKITRPSWSWSYDSLIYNYLCNQCLSPLTLWVRIPLRRGVLDTALIDSFSVTCVRSVVFSGYSGFLHQ
jgi:hypothetical protein